MLDSLDGGECTGSYSGVCADGRMDFVGGDVWVRRGVGTLRARGVEDWEWVEGGNKTMGGGGGDVKSLICCSDGAWSLCLCG